MMSDLKLAEQAYAEFIKDSSKLHPQVPLPSRWEMFYAGWQAATDHIEDTHGRLERPSSMEICS